MNMFYIARHGKTLNNEGRRLSGWIDTPLTPDGLKPTEAVIKKLTDVQVDAMYSSDMGRAFITAYAIARGIGFAGEIHRLPGLREVNYGTLANMRTDEAYALYPQLDRDTNFVPPGGESLDHMQRRVFAAIDELNRVHAEQNILLVCHSGVMAALRANNIGQDFGEHNISEAYEHDYVGRFTFADGRVTMFEEFVG